MKTFFLKEKPFFNIPHKYYCVQYYWHRGVYLQIRQRIVLEKDGIHIDLDLFGTGFNLLWTWNTDHAGIHFGIDLPFVSFRHSIYDSRHWDYDKNTWYNYPLESKKKEKKNAKPKTNPR